MSFANSSSKSRRPEDERVGIPFLSIASGKATARPALGATPSSMRGISFDKGRVHSAPPLNVVFLEGCQRQLMGVGRRARLRRDFYRAAASISLDTSWEWEIITTCDAPVTVTTCLAWARSAIHFMAAGGMLRSASP